MAPSASKRPLHARRNKKKGRATASAKLWSGRFAEPVDELVKRFTASVSFDRRLAPYDLDGSLAHARMLAACGIIPKTDLAAIERGLAKIRREIDAGTFKWSLDAEDGLLRNDGTRATQLVRP